MRIYSPVRCFQIRSNYRQRVEILLELSAEKITANETSRRPFASALRYFVSLRSLFNSASVRLLFAAFAHLRPPPLPLSLRHRRSKTTEIFVDNAAAYVMSGPEVANHSSVWWNLSILAWSASTIKSLLHTCHEILSIWSTENRGIVRVSS